MNTKNLNIISQNQALTSITMKLEDIIKTEMVWDNIVSLNGPAGTGKTYLTTKLIKGLSEKYNITITAPTHKALQVIRQNLEEENIDTVCIKTLQSFLNIRLVTDYDKGVQKFEALKFEEDQTKTDILIIDESSMVSSELYDFVVSAIEKQRVKAVLFVGDEYQLLPMDSLSSKINSIPTKYRLDKIVRQAKDSYIISMATKAREIIKSKNYISLQEFFADETFKNNIKFFSSVKAFHNDFATPENWAEKDKVIASFTNNSVDTHNKIIRNRYWEFQYQQNAPTLLKGDKVIFQQANIINKQVIHQNNDIVELSYAEKVHNNKLNFDYWDCKDLNNSPFKVIDPKSKERFKIILNNIAKEAKKEKDFSIRKKKWKIFFDIKELFIDVKYIYASTIHKLQGSTYETVYIDIRDMEKMRDKDMMFRLLYVAITRASKNVKILIDSDDDESLALFQENSIESIDDMLSGLGLEL